MVFGAFLWILWTCLTQTSPAEFVVREIRACCHHQISLQCGNDRSKIAIIQARYVVDRGSGGGTGFHATQDQLGTPAKSISLWDMDLKFAHDFMAYPDHSSETELLSHLNSPDWFQSHSQTMKNRYHSKLGPSVSRSTGESGLNYTRNRVIEMPPYEMNFMDKKTLWSQPLFSVVQSESDLSASISSPCLSYEFLSGSSSKLTKGKKPHSGSSQSKPSWHYKDLRAVFNQRCSGRSSCNVYLLWNKYRDEELTRVCHKWPDGLIVVKYLCFDSMSGDVHSKCNEDVRAAREGFLVNPGYPDYYKGDRFCQWRLHVFEQKLLLVLFDISLRGQEKSKCRDELIVSEDEGRTNLFSTCGDHSNAVAVLSLSSQVNVTLMPQSRMAFPKRGFLVYFRVIGCLTPEGPLNSNMLFRNATHAYFLCKSGHIFPDTLTPHRWLLCNPLAGEWKNHWTAASHPQCEDIRDLLEFNSNIEDVFGSPGLWPVTYRKVRRSFFSDYILPTVILVSLFLFNTIIILYIRRRRSRQEEIENEENQEMEQIQGQGTPEESTFTLSSDGMSGLGGWERPVMNFAEVETELMSSVSATEIGNNFHLGHRNGQQRLSNGSNGINSTYTNGTIFLNGLGRSTPV